MFNLFNQEPIGSPELVLFIGVYNTSAVTIIMHGAVNPER
jgi:hypothetical protein